MPKVFNVGGVQQIEPVRGTRLSATELQGQDVDDLCGVLADLATVDLTDFPDLPVLSGKIYVQGAEEALNLLVMERGVTGEQEKRLRTFLKNVSITGPVCITNGDFRPENAIRAHASDRVIILDWEYACYEPISISLSALFGERQVIPETWCKTVRRSFGDAVFEEMLKARPVWWLNAFRNVYYGRRYAGRADLVGIERSYVRWIQEANV